MRRVTSAHTLLLFTHERTPLTRTNVYFLITSAINGEWSFCTRINTTVTPRFRGWFLRALSTISSNRRQHECDLPPLSRPAAVNGGTKGRPNNRWRSGPRQINSPYRLLSHPLRYNRRRCRAPSYVPIWGKFWNPWNIATEENVARKCDTEYRKPGETIARESYRLSSVRFDAEAFVINLSVTLDKSEDYQFAKMPIYPTRNICART